MFFEDEDLKYGKVIYKPYDSYDSIEDRHARNAPLSRNVGGAHSIVHFGEC